MARLEGKVALVTGASRGIGKATAQLFAEEGGRVACVARTLEEGSHPLAGSLRTAVDEIHAAGGEAVPVVCDVSEYDECRRAVDEVRETYGPLEVLVNNAALTYFLPIAEMPVRRWLRSMAVNVNAPFYLARLALEDMIPARRGAIVNVSSGAAIGPGRGPYGEAPRKGGTLYGAEKAALERFTQGLASEVYEHGISVACVSPSLIVPTPGVVYHRLLEKRPDPRSEPPEVMARAILLLASEPLDRVTGRVTYSQQLLAEVGLLDEAEGLGVERPGSGYSQM
jgi:NAD(P)-dependent dehydrogenase (short-subunit alcohol dehydrogenase family)